MTTEGPPHGFTLVALSMAVGFMILVTRHKQKNSPQRIATETSAEFLQSQQVFLRAYLLALLSEWMQQAYLVMLLHFYGRSPSEIALIWLVGAASQHAFSFLLELAGGAVSKRSRCLACVVMQGCSSFLLLHPAHGGLVFSRIVGGLATCLLQSAFEGYMSEDHLHQAFPQEWLYDTFNLLTNSMAVAAVAGGILSQALLTTAGWSAPMTLAATGAAANTLLIGATWRTGPGKSFPRWQDNSRLLTTAVASVAATPKIAQVALLQGLVESAMIVFSFAWTPLVLPSYSDLALPATIEERPPYGLIFAQFMLCVLIGSFCFKLLSERFSPERLMHGALITAMLAFVGIGLNTNGMGSWIGCLVFEVAMGCYLSCVGHYKGKYIPQDVRGVVVTASRLLVSLPSLGALVMVAESRPAVTFGCALLVFGALVCHTRLMASAAREEEPEELI
ncbi:unnamed protein product [Chrysoparadoxa australica]